MLPGNTLESVAVQPETESTGKRGIDSGIPAAKCAIVFFHAVSFGIKAFESQRSKPVGQIKSGHGCYA